MSLLSAERAPSMSRSQLSKSEIKKLAKVKCDIFKQTNGYTDYIEPL